jgi:hypothetical protein
MKYFTVIAVILMLFYCNVSAQSNKSTITKQEKKNEGATSFLSDVSISGQWFLSYQFNRKSEKEINAFALKRGYLTFKKKLTDDLSIRYTHDITIDKEGDGIGDIELRFKYLYIRYSLPSFAFFTKPYVEFGVVHRPWLDFEQKINKYRVQGTMLMERNGILSSADYGLTFVTLFGGQIDKDYQKSVNKSYPGKYGSLSFGVYNGAGYHAIENNKNKVFDGRLSIRPIPEVIPGLQISGTGIYGKGNTEEAPDFNSIAGMLSFESTSAILTAQFYTGEGDQEGNVIDTLTRKSICQKGYSFFGEFFIPNTSFSIWGRYDYFKQKFEPVSVYSKRIIAGATYYFYKGSKLLIDIDTLDRSNSLFKNDYVIEFAVEVLF